MDDKNPSDVLREFGHDVTIVFDSEQHPARRDFGSGYVYFDPPAPSRLWKYYNEEYGQGNQNYYKVEDDYQSSFCEEIATYIEGLAKAFEMQPPLRVHELGCAFGGKVDALLRRGHAATGSDINETAIVEGQRVKGNRAIVHRAHLDYLLSTDERFDVIFGLHTLEHDPALLDVLRACRDRLDEGGVMMFRVPNVMYIRAILDGFVSHPWTDYPAHLHMMSAGYVGSLCDELGLAPLSILTRSSFGVDPELPRHFSAELEVARNKQTWDFLISSLGLGMELEFILTHQGTALAKRHGKQINRAREQINVARSFELAARDFLSEIPY